MNSVPLTTIFQSLEKYPNVSISCPMDALVAAIHGYFISRGFVLDEEDVPPTGTSLPPPKGFAWASGRNVTFSFQYKHPRSSHVFVVQIVPVDTFVWILARPLGDDTFSTLSLELLSSRFFCPENFGGDKGPEGWIHRLEEDLYPVLRKRITSKLVALEDDEKDEQHTSHFLARYPGRVIPPGYPPNYPPPHPEGSYGRGDLYPAGPPLPFNIIQPRVGGPVGGGNLYGPEMFRPSGMGGDIGGIGPMRPRFDPYYPDGVGIPPGSGGSPDPSMFPMPPEGRTIPPRGGPPTHGARFPPPNNGGGYI